MLEMALTEIPFALNSHCLNKTLILRAFAKLPRFAIYSIIYSIIYNVMPFLIYILL